MIRDSYLPEEVKYLIDDELRDYFSGKHKTLDEAAKGKVVLKLARGVPEGMAHARIPDFIQPVS